MKMKCVWVLLLATLSFSNSFADTKRIKYLVKLANSAEEARINLIVDIGHSLFKRYCPKEHSLMTEYLRLIVQKYPRITGPELEDQKQGALVTFSEKCANKPSLVAFSVNLNQHLEGLSSQLVDRALKFFDTEEAEMPLKTKNQIAQLYFQKELTQTFTQEAVMAGAHLDEEFDSPTYFSYLKVTQDLDSVKEHFLQ